MLRSGSRHQQALSLSLWWRHGSWHGLWIPNLGSVLHGMMTPIHGVTWVFLVSLMRFTVGSWVLFVLFGWDFCFIFRVSIGFSGDLSSGLQKDFWVLKEVFCAFFSIFKGTFYGIWVLFLWIQRGLGIFGLLC